MTKDKISNKKKLVDRWIIINKQRNSSFLPFLRLNFGIAPKNRHNKCFQHYLNDYRQNLGIFVDFYRIFIFPGCPDQVGRTDEITFFAVFRENRVFWSNLEISGTLSTWHFSTTPIWPFRTAKIAGTPIGTGGPDLKSVDFRQNFSFKSYFTM